MKGTTMIVLESRDDKKWLQETHLPQVDCTMFTVILLHGNEDAPKAVDLYAMNDYRCRPVRLVCDDNGNWARGHDPVPSR